VLLFLTFSWIQLSKSSLKTLLHAVLASAAVGTVEYRSMTEAVRASNPMIDSYIEGRAVGIDIEKQVIKVQLQNFLENPRSGDAPVIEVQYDNLVVAVGCKVADTIVSGAADHALRLKTCEDARRLRSAVGECLEYASRPDVAPRSTLAEEEVSLRRQARRKRLTFCIVGGGPTGVKLAGDLSDFFRDCTRDRVGPYQKLKDDISVVLVQGAADLVPQFEQGLRDHALQSLREQGVDVRLNTRVNEVGDGWIKLAEKEEEQKNGLRLV
jgi:NADH dehydrogenase FAD-containing subunit